MKVALGAMTPGMKNDTKLDKLVDGAFRMNLMCFVEHARELSRFNYSGKLAGFKGPVSFIIGRKDTLITEEMARRSAAEFVDAKVEVIEGIGHSLMVEDPATFVKKVAEFSR